MLTYKKYNIKDADKFNPEDFPKVISELAEINEKTSGEPVDFKHDIIISYLRNHSLQQDWITANPGLSGLITGGFLVTSHLESLFESCIQNKLFLHDFENYIRKSVK
jgi:hypothetical protein